MLWLVCLWVVPAPSSLPHPFPPPALLEKQLERCQVPLVTSLPCRSGGGLEAWCPGTLASPFAGTRLPSACLHVPCLRTAGAASGLRFLKAPQVFSRSQNDGSRRLDSLCEQRGHHLSPAPPCPALPGQGRGRSQAPGTWPGQACGHVHGVEGKQDTSSLSGRHSPWSPGLDPRGWHSAVSWGSPD